MTHIAAVGTHNSTVASGAGETGLLVAAFLFFSFFPYIKVIPLPIDTQPTAVLLGMMLLFLLKRHASAPDIWVIGAMTAAAVALFAIGAKDLSAIRNITGYISLFVFAYLFFLIAAEQPDRLRRFVAVAICVWLAVGLMQVLLGKGFMTFLISDARTTAGRGVTSLAPEPTFYASQVLFLLIIHLILGGSRIIALLALISIFICSISSQVVMILAVATAASAPFMIGRRNALMVFTGIFVVTAFSSIVFVEFKDRFRIFYLLDIIVRNPTSILLVDASANERFAAIYVSFTSLQENMFLPHGISGQIFYEKYVILKKLNPEFLWFAAPNKSNLSGAGRIAFELGALFFLFMLIVIRSGLQMKGALPMRIFVLFSYSLLLFSAIPLAHPMLGAVIGVMIAFRDQPNASRGWAI
ncbi:hypothetical protein [Niveispirillum cyanobacteriorum]|uniref:Uncharacterized protein n=1 Tax=Niveispirillum cyanobacteriorum TaxID=1612173 RepID=A0A2K9NJ07_9PROT|nr:hypothetical protein [Niveispirillum cyanobacteriorum]AUN33070.1 hypothetical protein C0V82_21930 [Niveispirillum cyanobacteriorum]GGE45631.1 hypothetical protein GCM10011317_00140 [Niveispirillum cyanobacteriorum]